jgi:twinkle protein
MESSVRYPCKVCGSSDSIQDNGDGWGWCYSCEKSYPFEGGEAMEVYKEKRMSGMIDGKVQKIVSRKISKETCQFYDVQVGYYNTKEGTKPAVILPYKDSEQITFAQKIRTEDKKFVILGDSSVLKTTLFGQSLFPPGGRKIIITEGEYDTLAISEAFYRKDKRRYPVVSVPLGASKGTSKISKVLSHNFDYINSFDEIILAFDQDEAGQNEVALCARMFDNKCRVLNIPLKDACDMWVADRGNELIQAVYAAQSYRPKGILTFDEVYQTVDEVIDVGLSYPWDSLTRYTNGMVIPSYNVLTAGTGVGKTTIYRAIVAHIIREDPEAKVGILFMEEPPRNTVRKLLSSAANKRFNTSDAEFDVSERDGVAKEFSGRVFFMDLQSVVEWESVSDKIRHLVVGEGCKYIFIDHITKFIDGSSNPNEIMGKINSTLSSMVMELDCYINAIAHTKGTDGKPFEEGGSISLNDIKGDKSVKQYPWIVLSIERDVRDNSTSKIHSNKVTILKCRDAGENTGTWFYLKYNVDTGELFEDVGEDLL